MKYMTSEQIREKFINYFKGQSAKHENVASSALVPANDPSLLFTNAGMVQFKDVFLGIDKRAYSRAVTSQKCLRVGGKHNDLDQVGFTTRHHTFFEMLGNFSFGDYFKEDAISYAWNFLTEELGLPKDRLWVTVYKDDQESADIWVNKMNFPRERLVYCGDEDNFWSMGDVGPCGPCTEIFYDHGDAVAGGPPGTAEADGDRYVEIWNIVFMQYDRQQDQSLESLPRPSVDTGMGLERIAAVMQGVSDNYDIDLFKVLLAYVDDIDKSLVVNDKAKRVMVDHIRSSAFLITDGIYPSNEGRGYVLRRIIRRAVRFGYKSGLKIPFFYNLAQPLLEIMGEAYPELVNKKDIILSAIKREEEQFAETIKQGMRVLDKELQDMQGGVVSGDVAFTLYDTYGFPLDLTQDALRNRGMSVEVDGFNAAMERQRAEARAAWAGSGDAATEQVWFEIREELGATEFLGYGCESAEGRILALVVDGQRVEEAPEGANAAIIVNQTPFYGESGGQMGDSGELRCGDIVMAVTTTHKKLGDLHVHEGTLSGGALKVGDEVILNVDHQRRSALRANHSATHLLHEALRRKLGDHVTQKGSLVAPERFRFDVSHPKAISTDELSFVEAEVNGQIRANTAVSTLLMTPDEAIEAGAMALFGEKYGEEVRVVSMGEGEGETAYSTELCGGTHVKRTGDIGLLKVLGEGAVAAGVRRIEALTGEAALAYLEGQDAALLEVASILKTPTAEVPGRVAGLMDERKKLEREVADLRKKLAAGGGGGASPVETKDVGGVTFAPRLLDDMPAKDLKGLADDIKGQIGSGVVALVSVSEGKVSLVVGVTADLTKKFSAVDLVRAGSQAVGGKGGGGRPDMAQAGGPDAEQVQAALDAIEAELAG